MKAPDEYAFSEKCVVYNNFSSHGPASKEIGCNGSLSKDGTVTIDIHYLNGSKQPLYVYMQAYPVDAFVNIPLDKDEADEVLRLPDVSSQKDFFYSRCCGYKAYPKDHVNISQSPGRVALKFKQNLTVASRDSTGHYNMYVLTFHVGERLYIRDNATARMRVAEYLSYSEFYCYPGYNYDYYDCGVLGAFVAMPIPQ